jgi:hypothetical protein
MSGGSFNYLFMQEGQDLLTRDNAEENVEAMAKQLAGYGQAGQLAAARTQALLLKLQAYRAALAQMTEEIDAGVAEMSAVWKNVEWHQSGDYGKDDVLQALAEHDRDCLSDENRVDIAVELAVADAIDDVTTPIEETGKRWQYAPELSPTKERRVQRELFHSEMSEQERDKAVMQFCTALDHVVYFASGRVKNSEFLLSIF